MTPKPKIPTASGISRLLAAAGFEKSESETTRVRGWHNHTSGYVAKRGPGDVIVYHQTGRFRQDPAAKQHQAQMEERYAQAIEAAGYAVARGDGGYFGPMHVTAKEA